MRRGAILLASACLLNAGEVLAIDTGDGEGNAQVALVSGGGAPGLETSSYLGVRFDIKPGWHIYWKNPGGAGLATEIGWTLPESVASGDLLWPLPIEFVQSGDIPGYGYEGSVVLASKLLLDGPMRKDATVGASVSWLACRDVCVLGSAELESTWAEVPVDPEFSNWRTTLPELSDRASPPFAWRATGGLSEEGIQLWLQWQSVPASVEWFPDPPEGLEVRDILIQTRGDLTRIDAVVRRLAGSAELNGLLDSLVVVTNDQQERRGWEIAVDLTENDN
jgi:DsbC/DsbD-like thiol-disulfide interchange protein